MYAVKEEVDVLKVQIKELLEKNQRLEMENEILRKNVTSEVIASLPNSQQGAGQSPSPHAS